MERAGENTGTEVKPVSLILIGGFLGAGKTTLMLAAARELSRRGIRPALITNDQAAGLVDTRLAAGEGHAVEEVAGACFCCRLTDFLDAARSLAAAGAAVILAEPVGSCTDIAATILQPVQHQHRAQFRLAPFTVLVDPARAAAPMAPDIEFLFRNQLDEADLVYFTKADLYSEFPALRGGAAGAICARTGAGVAEWLDRVLASGYTAGSRLLEIDYARYAEAEAALGWLNLRAHFDAATPLTPAYVVGPLLEDLDARLTATGAGIVHLKILAQAQSGYVRAGICANGAEPGVDGDLTASPARHHEVVINLRALADPTTLRAATEAAMASLPGRTDIIECQSFRPKPPSPEQRWIKEN